MSLSLLSPGRLERRDYGAALANHSSPLWTWFHPSFDAVRFELYWFHIGWRAQW